MLFCTRPGGRLPALHLIFAHIITNDTGKLRVMYKCDDGRIGLKGIVVIAVSVATIPAQIISSGRSNGYNYTGSLFRD